MAPHLKLLAIVGFGLLANAAQAQVQGMAEMDANLEAKMARERAKQNANRGARDMEAKKADQNSQCGSIELGNFDSGGRFDRAPREINVFVRGDVINADNRCR